MFNSTETHNYNKCPDYSLGTYINSFMFNNSKETHDWDKCAHHPLARLIQLFTFKHMQLEQKHRSPTCKVHSTASSEMQCKLGQKKIEGKGGKKKPGIVFKIVD
jgi:hypothetical protein